MDNLTLTDLANLALSSIGEAPINNIDSDNDPARILKPMLLESIREIQSIMTWAELKTVRLSSLSRRDSDLGLNYYNSPSDMLSIESVTPESSWRIEGSKIVSDAEITSINYIKYDPNPANWSQDMHGLVWRYFASEIAMIITGNANLSNLAASRYRDHESRALTRSKNRSRNEEKHQNGFKRNSIALRHYRYGSNR